MVGSGPCRPAIRSSFFYFRINPLIILKPVLMFCFGAFSLHVILFTAPPNITYPIVLLRLYDKKSIRNLY